MTEEMKYMEPSDPHSPVRDVLASGVFTRFLGMREGLHFEAKGKVPYDFTTEAGRYELAKDVTAFANSEGGHIVIGLATKPVADEKTDEVSALEYADNGESLKSQIVGILKEYTYPPVKDLAIEYLPANEDPKVGLVSVYIPLQDDDRKLFLISKVFEDKQEVKRIVVGIARRSGGSSVPSTAQELYVQIRDGRSSIAQRLTRIEAKVDRLFETGKQPAAQRPGDKLAQRIADLLGGG